MSLFHFGRTILASLFRKPVTTNYPSSPRSYPIRARGHVEIAIDECIFCSMCARKCPADAISVDRAEKTWTISPFSCVQCGSCVEGCPKKCLRMDVQYTAPSVCKTEEVFHARVPDYAADCGDSKPTGDFSAHKGDSNSSRGGR